MKATIRPKQYFLLSIFLAYLFCPFCVFAAGPANDLCGNAISLTSGTTCSPTSGTVVAATYTATLKDCSNGTPVYDVWYKFIAQTTNPTITLTLTGTGANFTAPKLELFSGACGGFTSLSCTTIANPGTGSIVASGLTVNTTYYIRVYSLSGSVPATNGTFNICVTDPAPLNDNCAGAIGLVSGTSCVGTTGNVISATLSAGIPSPTGCGTPIYDVWYSFTAQTTNPTIKITGNTNFANPHIQLLTGTCGSLAHSQCGNTGTLAATGLTIGTSYFIRVYSTSAIPTTAGTFSICVTDPAPANDACSGAPTLTSSTSCVTTQGNMVGATLQAGIPAPTGCGTPTYEVWYKFTAQTPNPTITVANNTNFTNPHVQILSGACSASFVHVACSNTGTLAASSLSPGTVYYIRVYSTGTVPTTAGTFDICVTDPVPANDDCSGAITLTPGNSCSNTAGVVIGATLSTGVPLPTCGTPVYDVWYTFVAQSTVQSITLSTLGTNFINAGIQLLSGSCGSLISVGCNASSALTVPGLTIGATYYVRVYSTSAVPTTNGTFNICVVNAPANDDCTGATPLTSATACSNTPGTLVNATFTAVTGACGTLRPDVWYTFTAQATNPTITIGSGPSNSRFQVFTGSCASPTTFFCSTSASQAVTGLTIGTTYLVRVYSNTGASGTFNICIIDPAPANDNCSGAVTLTSSTTCAPITNYVYGATPSTVTISSPDCAGTVVYDVWYKFVAQTTNPTITLANFGSDFTNPAMELLSNNCGSTYTPYFCGTTSIAADYLTPGTTYFIRVYSSSGTAPTTVTNSNFDICIVDQVATPPFNDECATAINLPIWNTCNNIGGNMAGATLSGGALTSPCTGTATFDVWYKFTAVTSNTATISLSSLGTNFTSSGLQVYSGTCGSLTAIACNNGTTVTTPALTTGSVYYVRVFSTAASIPNGNARFNICATTSNAPVRFGNSYVNLSKKTVGGVIQKGDTLEIRMTVNHTSGTMYHMRYVDNVPTNTNMLTTSNDSIRIITNEGLTYKRYTLGSGDDAATYKAAPSAGEFNIRLNLGFGSSPSGPPVNNTATESASATGQMSSSDKPKGGGGLLFATSYRVVVTGNVGDTVVLSPGEFIYQTASTGQPDVTLTATPFKILISNPLNLCANSIGLNNAVENGGTFGSGTTLNRSTDLTTPIAGYTFIPDVNAYNSVGDGRYAIVKNISPRSSPVSGARRQPNCNVSPTLAANDPYSCVNRMFSGFWYVDGDHSGTSDAIGNAPPDVSTPSGYMLEVNADYVASEVYRQTITNLCPNTYYEFSAWIRNICPNCGIDSSGSQFTGSSTAPAGGYPGVLPNLTFALNDLDYYNTGELDTVGWLKKGFVFKTDTAQTTATFSIRNNAQGGGGNDWALDDIAIATCLPSMQYSPSINPFVCQLNSLAIFDTVRSYFNNYTKFKWERSTDAGNNWTPITTTRDTSVILVGSTYQFITKYTIPPSQTTLTNSNDLYRVVVATSANNLVNNSCLYTDASTIITLNVLDCGPILKLDLLSFTGKNNGGNANLQWVTTREEEPLIYLVEKSFDGTNFTVVGNVAGHGMSSDNNSYQFADPVTISGKVWYRLQITSKSGGKKYSRIITLSDRDADFTFNSVVNPFNNEVDFDVSVPENTRLDVALLNLAGKPVRQQNVSVYAGTNSLILPNTDNLPPGMYILQLRSGDKIITKKLIKK